MELSRETDLAVFSSVARAFLLAEEARYALMLGHLGQLERGTFDVALTYLATLHDRGGVAGAALRLPLRDLVVTALHVEGTALLAFDCTPANGSSSHRAWRRAFSAWRPPMTSIS